MENKNNKGALTFLGVIMAVFGVIYVIVGTLALVGTVNGILPGHEAQEIIIVVLAYVVAVLALICGVACVKGKLDICRMLGMIFGFIGGFSWVYILVTKGTFSIFDCIAFILGAAIFILSDKAE